MNLTYRTDGGFASSAVGLLVLETDETLEPELLPLFARAGLACYVSRVPSLPTVTPENLARMQADLPGAAALLPQPARLPVIGYGCTSGANQIGSARVAALVQQSQPQAQVTNPYDALCAGLTALKARRIGFLSPYAAAVSDNMRRGLAGAGFEIAAFATFNEAEERQVARIDAASVRNGLAALTAQDAGLDAVIASCTNLRSLSLIAEAEQQLGLPVLTSNLALAWHMLQLAGLSTIGRGPGKLFNQQG